MKSVVLVISVGINFSSFAMQEPHKEFTNACELSKSLSGESLDQLDKAFEKQSLEVATLEKKAENKQELCQVEDSFKKDENALPKIRAIRQLIPKTDSVPDCSEEAVNSIRNFEKCKDKYKAKNSHHNG